MIKYFLIIIFLTFYSCNNYEKQNVNYKKIIINIQPFSDMTSSQVNYVYNELRNIYPSIVINKSIDLPKSSYYKARNRYRADSIVNYLNKRTENGHITIALTNKDISWTKDNISDFGIFGLGLCPGKACVASSFRLSKQYKLIQLFKVAIHELGHTQGLPHCSFKTCFMRDAEGKNPTNDEHEFCPKCKAHLIKRGWAL
jgi:archaemetzincin